MHKHLYVVFPEVFLFKMFSLKFSSFTLRIYNQCEKLIELYLVSYS